MNDTSPTERQIEYAKSLGINLTFDMTRSELSDLIDFTQTNDTSPTERHLSFADYYSVKYTKYIGKKALYESLASRLSESNRLHDRTSWFVFRVYRSLVKGNSSVSIQHPNDPVIQKISLELLDDSSFTNSLNRYDSQQTFLWFGEFEVSDGSIMYGASKTTNAYKLASSKLKEIVDVQTDMEAGVNRRLVKHNGQRSLSNSIADGKIKPEDVSFITKMFYTCLIPYRWIKTLLQRK